MTRRGRPSRATVSGTMEPVRLNAFDRQWREIATDAHAAFERVGASGWYILGSEVTAFEAALAAWWRLPFAKGVASGLDALEIALRATGMPSGAAVLTTPLSAFATTLAIVRAGGVPVFVDVDASGLIDLDRCEGVLAARPQIRHFIPVHLYGHCLDLARLQALTERFDLVVIEDCAQSIGAGSQGRRAGTVGRAAAVSFYPTKNLGALGDGGALLCSDAALAEHAAALRHYGQTKTYEHRFLGLNSRLDEVHAAILHSAFLPRLSGWITQRTRVAERYGREIANPAIHLPPVPAGSQSVWHLFPVLVEPARRDDFRAHLRSRHVESAIHYPKLIPHQDALDGHPGMEVVGTLEVATRFAAGEVSLPIHPFLSAAEVDRVIAACNEWVPAA